MRLSDAIALGRALCIPVPYYQDNRKGGGCALGMAARAVDAKLVLSDGRDWYSTSADADCELQMATPVTECPVCQSPVGSLGTAIAHAFNEHVFGSKTWTLDQLIDWVRSVEPAEPTEAQAEQDAKEVLQPAELSDLNAKLGQTLDQLHAHLVETTCDQSYIDGRSDTWREE